MIIDMFQHIRGPKYSKELAKRAPMRDQSMQGGVGMPAGAPHMTTLEGRFACIDEQCPQGCAGVLSSIMENIPDIRDEIALAQTANDEFAELIRDYPEHCMGAAALLPVNDIKASEKEARRALEELKLSGLLLYTSVQDKWLGEELFFPLYELAAYYDVPVWIHPLCRYPGIDYSPLEYDLEIGKTMMSLASSGVFERFPGIKFISHHGGGVTPLLYPRMRAMHFVQDESVPPFARNPWDAEQGQKYFENLKKFWFDTAFDDVATPRLEYCIGFFGIEKALFSGDFPVGGRPTGSLRDAVTQIEGLARPREEKELIYSGNARKLLKLV